MIKFSREWCMPNSDTFSMSPIKKIFEKYIKRRDVVVDPFARNSKVGTITNDLNPNTDALFHMDATDFVEYLISINTQCNVVLFDPPYSPRQVSEVYQNIGKSATQEDTQMRYKEVKNKLGKILVPGGIAISFGWNSTGFGKKRGFKIREIKLVAHGGAHNDTIVTVEQKLKDKFLENSNNNLCSEL